MLTNLSPQNRMFVDDINRLETRLEKAGNQISSGLAVTVPSDAPDRIGALLQLRANQAHNSQIQANLTIAQADAEVADNALASSIQLMDTATALATQGATATMDATSRHSLAEQVGSILQQMVANSQTNAEGRYVFSGDFDSAPQYTWNAATGSVLAAPSAAASTRRIESPSGGSFAASLTARQIFDDRDPATGNPATDNVFTSLSSLQTALQNNDTAGINGSILLLQAASNHLNTMQSFYGNVQVQIQNAGTYAEQYDTQLKTQISNLQDADIVSAATQFTQAQTQIQAAMEMQGQRPRNTLFNYLG